MLIFAAQKGSKSGFRPAVECHYYYGQIIKLRMKFHTSVGIEPIVLNVQ